MPDLNAICEGIAANLTVLLEEEAVKSVAPWLDNSPTMPAIQVAGVRDMTRQTYGGTEALFILVQALIGLGSDQHSQKNLNRLLIAPAGETSVWDAIESDPRLTSRYTPADGITTGQTAAADDVAVVSYDGAARITLPSGSEALLGTWTVKVLV